MCVPHPKTKKVGIVLEEPKIGTVVVVPLGSPRDVSMCAFQRYFSDHNGGENWVCTNCKRRVTWDSIKDYALVVYPQQITLHKKPKDFTLRAWNHGTSLHIVRNYETFCGRWAWRGNSYVVRQKDKARKFPVCIPCQRAALKKNFDLLQLVVRVESEVGE